MVHCDGREQDVRNRVVEISLNIVALSGEWVSIIFGSTAAKKNWIGI